MKSGVGPTAILGLALPYLYVSCLWNLFHPEQTVPPPPRCQETFAFLPSTVQGAFYPPLLSFRTSREDKDDTKPDFQGDREPYPGGLSRLFPSHAFFSSVKVSSVELNVALPPPGEYVVLTSGSSFHA